MAPGMLLLGLVIWPFLRGGYWSFTDYKLGSDSEKFIGADNYVDLLAPGEAGYDAFWTTLKIASLGVAVQMCIGLGVAMLLLWPAWWTRVFRVIVVIPLLMPPVVAAIMWKVMMVDRGFLNHLVETVGLGRINWLGDPTNALFSIVIIDTWIFTPFTILIFLAGLQSIPEEIVEAAHVDGASSVAMLRNIYLPMLRPFIVVVVVFRGIDSLKMFDVVWATTKGGPLQATRTLHVVGYEEGVNFLNYGRSMTVLLVLWGLSYLLAFVMLRKRREAAVAQSS